MAAGTMPVEEPVVSESTNREEEALRTLPGQLWARAHHEAAHAVVGTLLGGRVTEVKVWSGPPVGGRVGLTGLEDVASIAAGHDLVRRIVYALAGPIAEGIAQAGPNAIHNESASMA